MPIASDYDHAAAVIEALEATGLLVGDGERPDGVQFDAHGYLLTPFCVVYDQSSGVTSGPLASPNVDESYIFNIHCLGRTPEQARWVADIVKLRLLSGQVTIPGRALLSTPSLDTSTRLERDDDTAGPPLHGKAMVVRIPTTPA